MDATMPDPMTIVKYAVTGFFVLKLDAVATFVARNVPGYNPIINAAAPFLVPLFVKISPAIKPLYAALDILFMTNWKDPARPSASSKPIVMFCSRTIKDVAAYKRAFSAYAEQMQTSGEGVRAAFSLMDTGKENTALQFFWFDGPGDYIAQPSSLTSTYVASTISRTADYCQVWGGFDDSFKAAVTKVPGCKYGFMPEVRGFLREPTAANSSGFKTGSEPMIWISKRSIKPGRMASCGKNFQAGTDLMYPNAPAALGICEINDAEDDHATWALRVFNDYYDAFKAHFPVPSWILFRMVFNVIPEWVPGPFPIGFSFSAKADIEAAVASNAGNAAYKQFYWDEGLIGPKPDFAKGF